MVVKQNNLWIHLSTKKFLKLDLEKIVKLLQWGSGSVARERRCDGSPLTSAAMGSSQ